MKLIFVDQIIGIPTEQDYTKSIQVTLRPETDDPNFQAIQDSNPNIEKEQCELFLFLHFPQEYPGHIPKIELECEGFTTGQQESLF